jgi:hypothetical protein
MIRTLLVPVTENTSNAGGLAAAFVVAEAFQAHVDTLCIRPHPELHAPIEAASIPAPAGWSSSRQMSKPGRRHRRGWSSICSATGMAQIRRNEAARRPRVD